MRKIKRFSIILLSILTIFSQGVFAQIPNYTVVIGDKAYSMSYANKSENFKEIFKQISEADHEIYIKTNGKWYENSSGKIVSSDVIKRVSYKDKQGKVNDYAAKDGEKLFLTVSRTNFLNSKEIEICFNKEVDKEAVQNKKNYKIGETSLGENDKVMLKKDGRTVIITLNEGIEEKSECNIIVSKNITDLNREGLQEDYSNKILLLSKEKRTYNSIKEYKNDLNIISK